MSDFGEGKTLKTRTPHRCEWCGEGIDTHTLCFHYKGKFDSDWQDWYMHPECEVSWGMNCDDGEGFSPYENERPVEKFLWEAKGLEPPRGE